MIQPATYPDRGFAKIGPANQYLTEAIQKHIEGNLSDVYEIETSGPDVWLRSKERRTGRLIDFVEELALVDAGSTQDTTWIRRIDPYYDLLSDRIADDRQAAETMATFGGKDEHTQVYRSSYALLLTSSGRREAFLRDFYFPWFFALYMIATKLEK